MVLSVAFAGNTVAVKVISSPTKPLFSPAIVILSTRTTDSLMVISCVVSIAPFLAVIVTLPAFNSVTTPSDTVASVSSLDNQITILSVAFSGKTVATSVIISSTSPTVSPLIVILSTAIIGSVMVMTCLSSTSPALAVIVTAPTFNSVTTPLDTVASVSSLDDQTTVLSVAFSGSTVTVNVIVSPVSPSDFPLIVTVSTSTSTTGSEIEIIWVADLVPAVAVMVTLPAFNKLTLPFVTVANVSSLDDQAMVLSVAFAGKTVAVKVIISPTKPLFLPKIETSVTSIVAKVTITLIVALISVPFTLTVSSTCPALTPVIFSPEIDTIVLFGKINSAS